MNTFHLWQHHEIVYASNLQNIPNKLFAGVIIMRQGSR
jgi:hypothetical protein